VDKIDRAFERRQSRHKKVSKTPQGGG